MGDLAVQRQADASRSEIVLQPLEDSAPIDVTLEPILDQGDVDALVKQKTQSVLAGISGDPTSPASLRWQKLRILGRATVNHFTGITQVPTSTTEGDVALSRLSNGHTMQAYIDPATRRVVLREATVPLPTHVARQIDPAASRAILANLPIAGTPDQKTEVIDELATSYPVDANRVIAESGFRFRLAMTRAEKREDLTPGLREVYGSAIAARHFSAAASDWGGLVHAEVSDVMLAWYAMPAQRRTYLRHEVAHVLDAALGMISTKLEWMAIFDKTRDAVARGNPSLRFPDHHASTNPGEFFAVSVSAYLQQNVTGIPASPAITTRGDLLRMNPDAYAFVEKLFAGELAGARARPAREAAIGNMRSLMPAITDKSSAQDLNSAAVYQVGIARLSGQATDREALKRTLDALAAAGGGRSTAYAELRTEAQKLEAEASAGVQ